MKEATMQKLLEEFRKLDLDKQKKLVNVLEKARHSPRNRTEPNAG